MESYFEKFFNLSVDMLCIAGMDGYFKQINSSFERELGWSLKEMLNKPFIEYVHPDDISLTLAEIEKLKLGTPMTAFDNRFRCVDGSYKHLHWTAYPEKKTKLLYAIARNITSRKINEEMFQNALDASPSGMIMVDNKGKIVLVNKEIERIFNYRQNELVGESIELLIPTTFRKSHVNKRKKFESNPTARTMGMGRDLTGLRKDGSEFPLEVGLNPIETLQGKFVLGAVVDISQRKIVEQKTREVELAKSRFFTNISHDFRTPLTLILGPISQILEKTDDPFIIQQLEVMQNNADRMLQLINRLLDLSKLDANQMRLKPKLNDIVIYLRGLVMSFSSLAKLKKINLQYHSQDEKLVLPFDQEVISKIVINLLSNAFKFTSSGDEITVRLSRVSNSKLNDKKIQDISTNKFNYNFVQIIVSDTGSGFPQKELVNIFKRFYQVDNDHTDYIQGTGIGLSLVKELVELHHGFIDAESTLNKGTTFVVELPFDKEFLTESEEIDSSLQFLSESVYDPVTASKYNGVSDKRLNTSPAADSCIELNDEIILVIEDNEDVLNFITEVLKPLYKTIEAKDGQNGIEKALTVIPDLVISDVMMPGKNGYEVCNILKTDEKSSHIPVILLTARADSKHKIHGLNTGADDYITKPFEPRELVARVKNLIESRKKLRERFKEKVVIKPSEIATNSMDEVFIEKIMNTIENHLHDFQFSVDDMANEVHLSQSQLYRKIYALTNQSTTQFILSVRLHRAAELLKNRSGNISEIAFDVGFTSPAYFTKCFREKFGCTPRQYVKKK